MDNIENKKNLFNAAKVIVDNFKTVKTILKEFAIVDKDIQNWEQLTCILYDSLIDDLRGEKLK